jgi:hypothetical protein
MLRMRKMDLAKACDPPEPRSALAELARGRAGFSDFPAWVRPIGSAEDKAADRRRRPAITLQGGTDIYPAVRARGDALRGVDAMTKHAIL